MLFIAIHTAISLCLFVRKIKDIGKFLFNRSDTPWIFTLNDIGNLSWQFQPLLFDNLIFVDDIDGDVVVNIAKNFKVKGL